MKYLAHSPAHVVRWEGNRLSYKGHRIELCHGRELLGLSLPQAAEAYGRYPVDIWLIFEFNQAPLPSVILDRIESDLRQRWA